MSTFAVEVSRIDAIAPHPNADRLELAQIKGWSCVVQKGAWKAGDLCIYIPIDSVLGEATELKLFPADSKVRPSKGRIRTIKLRGAISQGMVADPALFRDVMLWPPREGDDVAEELGITKYEPPVELSPQSGAKRVGHRQTNPHFRKYTGIENAKNYMNVFEPGDEVIATEKIHGTNFRAGYVPFHADTLWKKLKARFGFAPKYDFVYGSHNVQLQSKLLYKGFYDTNVYAEAVVKYRLREILKPGEVVYGEIYGDGIQKSYTYGCKTGERKLVVFDLMRDEKYLDPIAFEKWAMSIGLPRVPVLYAGPFDLAKIKAITVGDSVMVRSQKVREGVVVKPVQEAVCFIGRKMLKFISDEYLLKDQTDFH